MIKDEDIHTDDNDHRSAIARKAFKFRTDAPSQRELIRFADSLSREYNNEGLDSLDIGDALGLFLSLAESDEYTGNDSGECIWVSPAGFTVTVSSEWELFQWGIAFD